MKIRSVFFALSYSVVTLLADERAETTETEGIQEAIDEAPVLSQKLIEGENRIVTVEEIEPPVIPEKEQPAALPEEFVDVPLPTAPALQLILTPISARVVNEHYTHLTWTQNEERFEAWSNINFEYLRTVQSLQTENQVFHYILGVSSSANLAAQGQGGPGNPPLFDETYPMLLLVKGNIDNHEGLAPLVALLDHYELHELELLGANEELEARLAARRAEKAAEALRPPEKERITIKVWTREPETKKEGK